MTKTTPESKPLESKGSGNSLDTPFTPPSKLQLYGLLPDPAPFH